MMYMKYSFKKFISLFVAVLLAAALLSSGALADGTQSITLSAMDGDIPVPGITEKLYRVGDLGADGVGVLTGQFADYRPGEPLPHNNSGWTEFAVDLNGYIDANDIKPIAVGATDEKGEVTFTDLSAGIYFVGASAGVRELTFYDSSAFFIFLKEDMPELTAHLKLSSEPLGERKVFKIWDDKGMEEQRPESITVILYCNGEECDRVELSNENDWRYKWTIPLGYTWTLSEITPEGYTSKIDLDGEIFTVTNTPDKPEKPDEPEEPDLPQTGLTWWPVPLFFALALASLVVIFAIRRSASEEKNKAMITFIVLGVLLLSAGTFWTGRNFAISKRSGEAAELALSKLRETVPTSHQVTDEISSDTVPSEDTSTDDFRSIIETLPDYALAPDMAMPTRRIDGIDYIAQISVPSLDLDLPIASSWTYETLKSTPCRYSGSAYSRDLVLLAHNYATHFGGIGQLEQGDQLILTDMDGNIFYYEANCVEVLPPTAVEEVIDSGFDLTLFTCTVGGKQRICAHFDLVEEKPMMLTERELILE